MLGKKKTVHVTEREKQKERRVKYGAKVVT